ncbi:MAG: hypothetical protein COS89_02250 [Deltaproteobacteria bacterium CG07_land_8_20_14_0_80_38_7]|nr:MAG: hypothetical protein COS89_02250 [Deltaproteobacteria bacterium CG07_land_8_20_14_0_80_38_7]
MKINYSIKQNFFLRLIFALVILTFVGCSGGGGLSHNDSEYPNTNDVNGTLAAPENVRYSYDSEHNILRLEWDAVNGSDYYKVYGNEVSDIVGQESALLKISNSNYAELDNNYREGLYCLAVRAISNVQGEGALSRIIAIDPQHIVENDSDKTEADREDGPDHEGGDTGGGAYSPPKPEIFSITPPNRSTLASDGVIEINFTEYIDCSTLNVVASSDDFSTFCSSRLLRIMPVRDGYWSPSIKSYTINISSQRGVAADQIDLTYAVQTVFVREGASGDGTMDNPMGSIKDARSLAWGNTTTWAGHIGPWVEHRYARVCVAEGRYPISEQIYVGANVSIYGGFSNSDWNIRNPLEHKSTIAAADVLAWAIRVEAERDLNIVIDGFNIVAGSRITAIDSWASAITITNNIIEGSIHAVNSSLIIVNNVITRGVSINGFASLAPDIHFVIANNIIAGSGGVAIVIASYGVNDAHDPIIENNIIFTQGESAIRIGILQYGSALDRFPKILHNNNIFNAPTALYLIDGFSDDRGTFETIAEMEAYLNTNKGEGTATGNISEDISGCLDENYRFDTTREGCSLDSVTFDTMAKDKHFSDESWKLTNDIIGIPRTGNGAGLGWSIGAYEYN